MLKRSERSRRLFKRLGKKDPEFLNLPIVVTLCGDLEALGFVGVEKEPFAFPVCFNCGATMVEKDNFGLLNYNNESHYYLHSSLAYKKAQDVRTEMNLARADTMRELARLKAEMVMLTPPPKGVGVTY